MNRHQMIEKCKRDEFCKGFYGLNLQQKSSCHSAQQTFLCKEIKPDPDGHKVKCIKRKTFTGEL